MKRLKCSLELKVWLAKGLKGNASERFQTASDMMGHPWLIDFDFGALIERNIEAPFVPKKNKQYYSARLQEEEEKIIKRERAETEESLENNINTTTSSIGGSPKPEPTFSAEVNK